MGFPVDGNAKARTTRGTGLPRAIPPRCTNACTACWPASRTRATGSACFTANLATLDLDRVAEGVTHPGCIDLAVKLPERINLFARTVMPDPVEGQALAQLRAKETLNKSHASESRLKPLLQNQQVAIADWAANGINQRFPKAYADKYRMDGRPIWLLGVEFSRATRNVVGWDVVVT